MSWKSNFKTTQLSVIDSQEKNLKKGGFSRGGSKRNYHTIKHGENIFKLLPAHMDSISYAYPLVRSQFPWQYKAENGDMKDSSKKVFNAIWHGFKHGIVSDVAEEYIKFVDYIASSELATTMSEDDIAKWRKPITGYKDGQYFIRGIEPDPKTVMYAIRMERKPGGGLVEGEIGILEVGKYVKDELNKLAAKAAGTNPAGHEPFTSPDDGIPVIINFNKNASKSTDFYDVDFYTEQRAGSPIPIPVVYPLSDKIGEIFNEMDSLEKIYGRGLYTMHDFDLALEGLINFDNKPRKFKNDKGVLVEYEFGVFEYEEWQKIVEKCKMQVPEKDGAIQSTVVESTEKKKESGAPKRVTRETAAKVATPDPVKTDVVAESGTFAEFVETLDRQELKQMVDALELNVVIRKSKTDIDVRFEIVNDYNSLEDIDKVIADKDLISFASARKFTILPNDIDGSSDTGDMPDLSDLEDQINEM